MSSIILNALHTLLNLHIVNLKKKERLRHNKKNKSGLFKPGFGVNKIWFPRHVLIEMAAEKAGLYNREKGKKTESSKLLIKSFALVHLK